MTVKEATTRIKINKLLEAAGWRFFADGKSPANIQLEPGITIKTTDLDALGENFEKSSKGFIDYLLLNEKSFPFVILEAKAEDKSPLVGKEQSRKYARSQNCRFIILSNGNLHYFWDLERGNPYLITSFPTPASVMDYQKTIPNPDQKRLIEEVVAADYAALTQRPNYAAEAAWKNVAERLGFIATNSLRFLRPYQLKAIHALQRAIRDGKDRFLFEMATGTGKTLTAAAVIKLFLRTGNACRVLFLVDRLELEGQAWKTFNKVLANDYKTVIYKENRDDWRHAEIVVTTVQSLLFNNKYQQLFSPTDFDLVISDEAHRSIGGNARAVFDYFIGYKLGLTATPRDYLKRFEKAKPTTKAHANLSAVCCSTPTAHSAAMMASPRSAIPYSMELKRVFLSTLRSSMPAVRSPLNSCRKMGLSLNSKTTKAKTRKRHSSSASSRSAFLLTPPTSFSARHFWRMPCATRSAARSANLSSSPSAKFTLPNWRKF